MADREMEFPPYKVVCRPGMGVYEEKKSRFIANIAPAASEEEAVAFIESIRKKHYDARHNCPAFIIGRNRQLTRCSDDGEPGGTAGKPILEVLLGAELTDVVAVVTRYFGGTLLGTGGLVRAYTQAMQAGLKNTEIATMRYGAEMTIDVDYTDVGKVQHLIGSEQIHLLESRYTDRAAFDIRIPGELTKELTKKFTEATAGRARIVMTGTGYYLFADAV